MLLLALCWLLLFSGLPKPSGLMTLAAPSPGLPSSMLGPGVTGKLAGATVLCFSGASLCSCCPLPCVLVPSLSQCLHTLPGSIPGCGSLGAAGAPAGTAPTCLSLFEGSASLRSNQTRCILGYTIPVGPVEPRTWGEVGRTDRPVRSAGSTLEAPRDRENVWGV